MVASNVKYTHVLVRANKMADSCARSFDANSVALRRSCFTKMHVFIQSFAALRRSIGLLGWFVNVWKKARWTHKHNQLLKPYSACMLTVKSTFHYALCKTAILHVKNVNLYYFMHIHAKCPTSVRVQSTGERGSFSQNTQASPLKSSQFTIRNGIEKALACQKTLTNRCAWIVAP